MATPFSLTYKTKVLIVDDDPNNLLAFEAVLEELGHEVLTARSGREALELNARNDFAVILLDLMMPEMDGFEAASLLRKQDSFVNLKYTPVLILTGLSSQESQLRGYSAGAVDYLVKPVSPELLKTKVAAFIQLKQVSLALESALAAQEKAEHEIRRLNSKLLNRAKEALHSSEERLRLLIDSAIDFAIIGIDEQGRVTHWNTGAERLLGYRKEDIYGNSAEIIFTPEDRESGIPAKELTAARTHGRASDERWHVRKDGSRFWGSGVVSPVRDLDSTILGFVQVLRDMTRQKQAAGNLAKANARLEDFAYITSHDLQQPLRMVTSYLQLLSKRYKGHLDADADEFIGYAVDGAQRMHALIQSLLLFSRVVSSEMPLQSTDCNEILSIAIRNVEVAVEENQATLTHDPLPVVMGDAVQLIQLLQNLVSNAITFRSQEPPRVHIGVEERESEWLFCVKDNGIGFDQQHADRIFGVFKRLNPAEESLGTGIGLAICKRIVERHGGTIWAESEIANGSKFYFTIPKAHLTDPSS